MHPRARAAIAIGAALAGVCAQVACSAVFGIHSDRHLVVDEADADDGSTSADWSCFGQPAPPAPTGSVQLKMFVNDVTNAQTRGSFNGTPVVGAAMRSCGKLDFNCANPISNAVSDDAGIALLTVPGSFDGYYEVTVKDFTPSILSRSPQLANEYAIQGLASASLLALGAGIAQVTADPNLSFAIITAADCATTPAPGVQFTIGTPGANEKLVYLENSLPSASATETDYTGSAVVFNVPPGSMSVSATIAADQRPIRTVVAIVRTGWITFIQIRLDSSRVVPL